MITVSIIQKSQLEGALRLDAEYYQPEYFIDFTKGNWRPIGDFLGLCQYGLSRAMNDKKRGYPIFKMDDIHHTFLFDDEVRYIDLNERLFKGFKIEKDDVLFNRVNSEDFVGRTGIFKLDLDSVFASYLIRIRPKRRGDILPDYLNIFLNSSYGLKQIRKFARRAVNQANVNAEELKQIKIAVLPKAEQEKIAELSNKSWREFQNSKSLYSQAENLLLEELGLKNFEVENGLSYIVNLSEVKCAHRADAEYFQPQYDKLVEKLKKYKAKLLKELVRRVKTKIKLKSEEIYKYIEISDINVGSGDVSFNEIIGKELPANARIPIKGGELLVSKVRPTRGAIAIVPNDFNSNFICSGAFSVFGTAEILKEYLFVVLRSTAGKLQFEKPTTGTSYPTITDEDVENLIIPILPKPTQQKIADLVQKSHEARSKAKQLLVQAKKKVEELIV